MSAIELDPQRIAKREKLILVGLYLSKYDLPGLKRLGFGSFTEAFNVFGYAIGAKSASIKNYRDEFDPLFPNRRKGWHKRETRDYCLKIFQEYRRLDIESFTALVKSFAGYDENLWSGLEAQEEPASARSAQFAQRLITGLAAERYFQVKQPTIPEFEQCSLQDTTRLGCGYDFRLEPRGKTPDQFLAVEVKGLRDASGSLVFTPKEHAVANALKERFFLFVVKNFRESPSHEIFQNPLHSQLQFAKTERVMIQVSWVTNV